MVDNAQISIVRENGETTIIGRGTLDFTNSEEFHNGLSKASLTSDAVTVDFRPAEYIDSAVVQDLANAAVALLKRERRLKVIVKETGHPLQVLQLSGFAAIMDIEVDKSAA